MEQKKYEQALREILSMKNAIDDFFEKVMVMADEDSIRTNRLALLTSIAQLFLSIGDFSKMSATA